MYFATDEQISTLQNCSSATELIALFLNISTRCPTTICLTNNDGTEELDTSSIASPPIGVEESILSEYFRFGLGVSYDSNNQVVVYNVVVINLITINSNIFNAVFNYTITNNKIAVG
jgi:hypothetical protein